MANPYGPSNWPTIDPGLLRTPISIQALLPTSPVSFNNNGPVAVWQNVVECMAYIQELRGTDLINSGQDVSKLWMTITIRYQPGIQPLMLVCAPDYRTDAPGQTVSPPPGLSMKPWKCIVWPHRVCRVSPGM